MDNQFEKYNISKENLKFASNIDRLHERKLDTKPVSYLKDAFSRFKRNKASITAAIIIVILLIFAIFAPIFSKYTVKVSPVDAECKFYEPKNKLFFNLGFDFWDGCRKKEVSEIQYQMDNAIYVETGHEVIKDNEYKVIETEYMKKKKVYYQYRLNTYYMNGVTFKLVNTSEYNAIQKYQDDTGIQVIYPITEESLRPKPTQDNANANYWFKTTEVDNKSVINFDEDGNYINIYKTYTGLDSYTSKVRIEGDSKLYDYAILKQKDQFQIRIDFYEYYIYYHQEILKDGVTEPNFIFGTTDSGQDIWTALASGARFSLILAIIVSAINLLVGALYGAIEGYYGGKIDLIMERIVDILGSIPFMIVISLLKYHLEDTPQALILFIAFFVTGWIGMAGRTRMQFYRFKNQEYVLAARTLGAKDRRIMFKHIFPNAIGTLITGCVLVIPSVIFSETSLTYLGIIDLSSGSITSVGTLLAKGQSYLISFPHIILFPSVFISLLMLSFNLFGNGLRDAFNPSLRGTEE